MKNAVVFLATGFEEIEALGTIDVLRRGGVRVMMVSITGDRLVIGAHDIPVMADYLFEEADFSCVDAFILPGGIPGSNHLNAHAHLKELVKEKTEEMRQITAPMYRTRSLPPTRPKPARSWGCRESARYKFLRPR